ncbi:hypothetical protein [Streptomyces sp. NPDC055400]
MPKSTLAPRDEAQEAQQSDRHAPAASGVFINPKLLEPFLKDAAAQYHRAWDSSRSASEEQYLPRCWALLVGRMTADSFHVSELQWAGNVRESDPVVLEEFADVIVPCFGSPYTNGRRGYWCDPAELLRITRDVESRGLDLLGSIHMHADVHRFWPDHAAGQKLSQHPTLMDTYLFRNGGWPLNIICHLEEIKGETTSRLGAWAPPPFDDESAPATELPVHFTL